MENGNGQETNFIGCFFKIVGILLFAASIFFLIKSFI